MGYSLQLWGEEHCDIVCGKTFCTQHLPFWTYPSHSLKVYGKAMYMYTDPKYETKYTEFRFRKQA